mgnify:CR=1 FL=1
MADYIKRYAKQASKNYIVGYKRDGEDPIYVGKDAWVEFLTDTAMYVDEMNQLSEHYKLNGVLLEMILDEFASMDIPMDKFVSTPDVYIPKMLKTLDIQRMMDRIGTVGNQIIELPVALRTDNLIQCHLIHIGTYPSDCIQMEKM